MPGVDRHLLLFFAGMIWLGVGMLLLHFSFLWLHSLPMKSLVFFAGMGIVIALTISRFGFSRIVDKNVNRILPMEGKRCAFAFMSWKSYPLVAIMVTVGILIRRSVVPKPYLSLLYTGIGLALIISSFRYWKVFLSLVRKNNL